MFENFKDRDFTIGFVIGFAGVVLPAAAAAIVGYQKGRATGRKEAADGLVGEVAEFLKNIPDAKDPK